MMLKLDMQFKLILYTPVLKSNLNLGTKCLILPDKC